MAIKQQIHFNTSSSYFAGFLQSLIAESAVIGSVTQTEGLITLLLDTNDADALKRFAELSQKYLPHSLFLGDIQTMQENIEVHSGDFHSQSYPLALCPRCLEMLSDPASEHYLDDTLRCDHYANTPQEMGSDVSHFSPHYSEGDTLLVVDSQRLARLFIMTEEEQKALFSIEKPSLKVTILDEDLKNLTGRNFLFIKAPFDMKSTLVALNAKDGEVPYLFFRGDDTKVVVVQKNTTVIKDTKGICSPLEMLNENPLYNRVQNIKKEAALSEALIAYLSTQKEISFLVSEKKETREVLQFNYFVLQEVLQGMLLDTTRSKMLVNFEEKYPHIVAELRENSNFDLWQTLACILELKGRDFEACSDKALEFRGNGGLKIDMFYNEKGFDYISFLGSVMSFKLAGTEEHYLAYSVFEAFGDLTISTLTQLKAKYKIDHFIMLGDMFANPVLYSRILSKFQLSNPYFSKGFALDD